MDMGIQELTTLDLWLNFEQQIVISVEILPRGLTPSLETSARSSYTEQLEGENKKHLVLWEVKGYTLQSLVSII